MKHSIKKKLKRWIQKIALKLGEGQCAICSEDINQAASLFIYSRTAGAMCKTCSHKAINSMTAMRMTHLAQAQGYAGKLKTVAMASL